jgi:hypothetical protein
VVLLLQVLLQVGVACGTGRLPRGAAPHHQQQHWRPLAQQLQQPLLGAAAKQLWGAVLRLCSAGAAAWKCMICRQ